MFSVSTTARQRQWRDLSHHVRQQQWTASTETLRIILVLGAALVLISASAVYTPTVEYNPRLTMAEGAQVRATPEQRIASLLLGSGYLPRAGTQMVIDSATDRLIWHKGTDPTRTRQILRLTIDHVRVASSAPLLWSVLSRSPISTAEVKANAQTADGQWTRLTFVLWQYRLLLPQLGNVGNSADSVRGIWLPVRVDWQP